MAEFSKDDHDEKCHVLLRECKDDMEKWIKDQICITKKEILNTLLPTKARVFLMWSVMGIMLAAGLGSAWRVVSISISYAEEKGKNERTLAHLEEEIDRNSQKHDNLESDVSNINDAVNSIENHIGQQTQILKALAREHGIEVDVTR